jgi:hypothetical protein
MSTSEPESLLDWLRANCEGDGELLELIDRLARNHRDDLLRLVRDYRSPLLLSEAEIIARVGSAEAVERQLAEIHEFLWPITKRRYETENTELIARKFYARMRSGKIPLRGTIHDPAWTIDHTIRRRLLNLWDCARPEPPDEPVAYEQLQSRLNLKSGDEVRDLILLLRDRHNELRSPQGKHEKGRE